MQKIPVCQHCFNADLKHFPLQVKNQSSHLWYCENCEKSFWFHGDVPEKIEGLAFLCDTRRSTPEKCHAAVLQRFGNPVPVPGGPPGISAPEGDPDQICIDCPNKNFVIY